MGFRPSLNAEKLTAYVARQLENFFPDGTVAASDLRPALEDALDRLERCFTGVKVKYYRDGGDILFDHLHTDQYAAFLYLLSNSILRRNGNPRLAGKVYALNKTLHGLDIFYEVELPEIFCFQHPVGTVLGRAKYSNYLFVYQRCSTGAKAGVYPRLGEGVVLFPGSAVIGDCAVGENVWLSAGTLVMSQDIPGSHIVFGTSPKIVLKSTRRDVRRELFGARN